MQAPPSPITWNTNLSAWAVWQYEDVLAILKDARFSANSTTMEQLSNVQTSELEHLAYRQELIPLFQQAAIWTKKQLQVAADDICTAFPKQDFFDLQQDIILPYCQRIAFIITGIDIQKDNLSFLLEQAQAVFLMTNGGDTAQAGQEATIALSKYFLQRLEHYQTNPQDDLMSIFAQSSLPNYTLLSPVVQQFVGLSTSLPLLLGNIMLALLRHSDQTTSYLQNPNPCLGELLRYASPAQFVYRLAVETVQFGEHTFERGDKIALFLAQANYDSNIFPNPETLDFQRNAVAHLSLGKGAHSCLGAPMIRDACAILPATILKYFPNLQVEMSQVSWGGSKAIRGVVKLPVFV